MVKVSIIVPVYNVESYLERCLDSLINQTLKDIEIIVVNDGSPDNSQELIDRYKKKDRRVISLMKENGGLSSARNYGLKKATGEYIGYVDSDDWIDHTMYEKMYKKAKEDDSDIVSCDYYKAYDNGNHVVMPGLLLESNDMKKNYIISVPCAWNKIYKREIISKKHWPEGMIYEDFASNPLLIKKINKISYVDEPLYYYFIRETSIMNDKVFKPKFYDILKASQILNDNINKDKYYLQYKKEYEYLIIDNLLRDTYFRLKDVSGSKQLLKDIVDFIKENYCDFLNNPYIKKRGWKYRFITKQIYKRHYKLLNFISRS